MESNRHQNLSPYYLIRNGKSTGPFQIEELMNENLNLNDWVWTEGMKDWDIAENIAALSELIISNSKTPPPIPAFLNESDSEEIEPQKTPVEVPPFHGDVDSNTSTEDEVNTKVDSESNQRESSPFEDVSVTDLKPIPSAPKPYAKYVFLILGLALITILIVYMVQLKSQNDLVEETLLEQERIIENHQQQFEAQNLAEQERLNAEELAKRNQRIEELNLQLEQLQYELDETEVHLVDAKYKLEDIHQFQLLRTESEKRQQIQDQLRVIQNWEDEKERLLDEIKKAKSELRSLSF